MKLGLKARFSDLEDILTLRPDFVEFQFSDKDPDYRFSPETRIPIPCIIHLPEMYDGYLIDLSSISKHNQVLSADDSVDIIQKMIHKSEKFFRYFTCEENIFVLHPGGMSFEEEPDSYRPMRLERLAESIAKIKTTVSEIYLENHAPLPWYFGGNWISNIFLDAEEMIPFCKKMKKKICYDISHSKLYCNYRKIDFWQQFNLFKKQMSHFHIADAQGADGEGIQIGEGEIDFQKVFRGLAGYDGYIVPEIWMGYANNFSGFKIAMERLRKFVK